MSDTFGAIKSFEKANELSPRTPTTLLALGIAKQSQGSYGEAIEAFIRRHNERAKPFRWRKREVKGSQIHNTIVNLRN